MNLIYSRLSAMKFIGKSYNYKFLFIAFTGIHIPLIGLIIFVISKPQNISPSIILIVTLILTLAATALTLYLLQSLLEPLSASQLALENYLVKRTLPELPEHFEDEAGVLMKSVQHTVIFLDNLLKEKRDLISLLAHDLRLPLANIRLLSQAIERLEVMGEGQRKEIGALITNSVNEQIQLFQQVLDILKNDEIHALQLNRNEVSCKLLINNAVQELKALADAKQLDININVPENAAIYADVKMLGEVVKNLLNNAIKFSYRGSTIYINSDIFPNNIVRIAVQDSGLGFNSSDSEKLFQRFSKLSHAGTENEQSTGMGLYLSKKIVEAHNGTITAYSEGMNQGAVFVIDI